MSEYQETILNTKFLVHKAKDELEHMLEITNRLIQLSEELTKTCDKFLEVTEVKVNDN